jgi:pentapeptide MXKDX repeat protein
MGSPRIKAHLAAEVLINSFFIFSTRKTICKPTAGLALLGLCLTAYAQTTPMPERKVADGKMKADKMYKDKVGEGKMAKKESMEGDKMAPKI